MTADHDDLSALVLGVLGGTGDQGRGSPAGSRWLATA